MNVKAEGTRSPCARCKEHDGVLDLRSERVCQTCFTTFVASKAIKRLEVLQRETRGPRLPSRPQRYLVALSRGPSSTALLHVLSENRRRQLERNQRAKFELVVAFVDVDADVDDVQQQQQQQSPGADPFAAHFPGLAVHRVPLSDVLSSPAVDWASLPVSVAPPDASLPAARRRRRLADLLARLPSAGARADVARLLTRHALLAFARARGCGVVLLGHTTTSLAELTLSEAAKGRGFGIPWLVNDGALPSPSSSPDPLAPPTGETSAPVQVYSPLREIFRKEVRTYLEVTHSPAGGVLADLFFPSPSPPPSSSSSLLRVWADPGAAVVSHRDLSLDDVVARYFAGVEAAYPSVVANVVRTTGKLSRPSARAVAGVDVGMDAPPWCGLCGVGLDPLGDERWKGEIGDADGDGKARQGKGGGLCYGCERSVRG
ncbi:putative cytoplasmic tRNA 2-thiolation protein 2 [Rosellinia necatrix]|uniref:Cytoplasmic tRNA 2-thiolation protein 2 n=1 Tax=Rosellinia necatrix TaxID=77044 RepID=A0A1W2THW0_ROSNE|nr:putative cytoplasmic tRNA 2-thiolation protein 2 [Rosellinia necatrix]